MHQAYNVPLTMHITPTLASAIQWASVAPGSAQAYKDGPALNKRIASMVASGQIDLISSTFSDHILKYFGSDFNANNVALANKFLQGIYGQAPSPNVFWLPEQVANDSVLAQVQSLGFGYTFIDQTQHMFNWFGRTAVAGRRLLPDQLDQRDEGVRHQRQPRAVPLPDRRMAGPPPCCARR